MGQNIKSSTVDRILPKDHWEFDKDVTDCFEDMLQRSIPQYEIMRKAVFDLACQFRQHETTILDIGSSRGDAIAPLIEKFGAYNSYMCCEISQPMIAVLRERFQDWDYSQRVAIREIDLREEFPPVTASVILSILTLMFIPLECRQQVIQSMYDALLPGGALLFVEKILGASAKIDKTLVSLYYQKKQESGYTPESIERKRLSLQGVLVPVTAKWNEELLRAAGFTQVECFWRWMNFAGWIAIK